MEWCRFWSECWSGVLQLYTEHCISTESSSLLQKQWMIKKVGGLRYETRCCGRSSPDSSAFQPPQHPDNREPTDAWAAVPFLTAPFTRCDFCWTTLVDFCRDMLANKSRTVWTSGQHCRTLFTNVVECSSMLQYPWMFTNIDSVHQKSHRVDGA